MNPTPQPDSPEQILAKIITRETHKGSYQRIRIEALAQIEKYYTNKFLEGYAKQFPELSDTLHRLVIVLERLEQKL